MNTNIYQIFYHDSQLKELDPAFVPYNNKGRAYPSNFEYAVFFDLYKNVDWETTSFLGSVSWKFYQKTGLSGEILLSHISKNPNMDVYFVNPFPELCIYRSVWDQGNEFHPNLIKITSALLKECGYSDEVLYKETPPNLTAYCNYWVANKKFWDAYINFITPFWDYILKNNNALTKNLMETADPFIKAPYLPFVFERLFSTFLMENNFKVHSVPVSQSKMTENPYLSPILKRIIRVSHLESHSLVSWPDRVAIGFFSLARKLRHYHLPLIAKKLRGI
jgi:hypothetical protein